MMEELTSGEVAKAVGGELIHGTGEERAVGVSIDTRTIEKGQLFFAIIGERYDAHQFLPQAWEQGAGGAVVEEGYPASQIPPKGFLIRVDDTTLALGELASYYLNSFELQVVAITGSVGKTTTKDMVASVLGERYSLLKTDENYNNQYGLPLTIFQLESHHQLLVLEMGMSGLGEITYLCRIASPQLGIITNVGPTHLEELETVENVARGKAELAEALPEKGALFLNGDDPLVRKMSKKSRATSFFYGLEEEQLDYRARSIASSDSGGTVFTFQGEEFFLPLPGRHNLYNALAALGLGSWMGMEKGEMAAGLKSFQPSSLRMNFLHLDRGVRIINDTYNASPLSMRAALETLQQTPALRRIAVLGDMLELGLEEEKEHLQLGALVYEMGIDLLFSVGELGALITEGARAEGMPSSSLCYQPSLEDLAAQLTDLLQEGDLVLFKASRGIRLEQVVTSIESARGN